MTGDLAVWLTQQRWFGGKGRDIAGVTEASSAVLRAAEPEVRLVVLRVAFADGGVEDYQLLVGRSPEVEERLEHAVISTGPDGVTYDATHDPTATSLLLEHLAAGGDVDGLTFTAAAEVDAALPGRVMTAEQSNTSVVYGDALILKLFRRLQPGANPDIEITKALADEGCTYVAPPLAWLETEVDGEQTTLGLLQPFLRGASEGWAMATASVRDLLAEQDLHADEVGGDFAGESERLGHATGEVHQLMARALRSATAGPQESRDTADQLRERLDAALLVTSELAEHAEAIRSVYAQVERLQGDVPVQRVHGDLHLGQVLRTQDGWVLLDFEGEPMRSLADRRALMSPLRDVAGMLRSFDYAAHHLLAVQDSTPQLAYRANEWADRNRSAFCDGYGRAVGNDPRDQAVLLLAFELDKAVYEVVYEARNRPTWLPVPLASIARLLGGRA